MYRILPLFLLLAACQPEPAETVKVSPLFSNHAILQRNADIPVWGLASPGKTVEAMLGDESRSTIAGQDSAWIVWFPALEAGDTTSLSIIAKDTTYSFSDLITGDVYLASGQSNMEMPIAGWGKVKNYQEEIKNGTNPNIRFITIERATAYTPSATPTTKGWMACDSSTLPGFSATAFFFARNIQPVAGVPIGIIHSSWGGTIAEAWTSKSTLSANPDFADALKKIDEKSGLNKAGVDSAFKAEQNLWLDGVKEKDKIGLSALKPDSKANWKSIKVPGTVEENGLPKFDGILWLRKKVTIPETWAGQRVVVRLGPIDDVDNSFWDNQILGTTFGYMEWRTYVVAKAESGVHQITIRVIDTGGGAGLWANPGEIWMQNPAGEKILLDGDWEYAIGYQGNDFAQPPGSASDPNQVTVLYNGMIAPVKPYPIKGVIWYQGESNVGRAIQYRKVFSDLITDWRKTWGIGDFPFFFVQLANFTNPAWVPVGSAWAELREAQTMALSLPNTGMAVAIDIGDSIDIHPKNKQEVGRRLALQAASLIYKDTTLASGPMADSIEIRHDTLRIHFKFASGLRTKDGYAPKGFTIAGSDQVFRWAKAWIEGETVVLKHPAISQPAAVRYGWDGYPIVNLVNRAGLPANPFRSDTWPGVTEGIK
ncbi:MAG: 9-O-acetylesterase [Bacteroidetes bacterium]|nr:9-O-acetylesterase [Bacteroidota bacterium]